MTELDPRHAGAEPPQPAQGQTVPGSSEKMNPRPDYGEDSYRGSGRLQDRVAIVTGGDSGIGRAVCLAFAREGADVVVSFLSEDDDARETQRLIESAGRKALLIRGDITEENHCRIIIEETVKNFGRIDILVNNAAYQMTRTSLEEITTAEWDRTFKTNIYANFWLTKAALPHMKPGSAIISTASVNFDMPRPTLAPYAATKAAIVNFTGALAQLLAEKGIRANSVAPGPIWTPLIPSTMPEEHVKSFGQQTPLGRAGQPAELAPVYVLLASPEASYVSGANVAVTGGKPMI
jgi:NAD(P)-dependent dehydrogenase (short-subunit alcohol dehydrogenase family)